MSETEIIEAIVWAAVGAIPTGWILFVFIFQTSRENTKMGWYDSMAAKFCMGKI